MAASIAISGTTAAAPSVMPRVAGLSLRNDDLGGDTRRVHRWRPRWSPSCTVADIAGLPTNDVAAAPFLNAAGRAREARRGFGELWQRQCTTLCQNDRAMHARDVVCTSRTCARRRGDPIERTGMRGRFHERCARDGLNQDIETRIDRAAERRCPALGFRSGDWCLNHDGLLLLGVSGSNRLPRQWVEVSPTSALSLPKNTYKVNGVCQSLQCLV